MQVMRSLFLIIGWVLAGLFFTQVAFSQTSKPPLKSNNTSAAEYTLENLVADRTRLSTRAKKALAEESAREKAKICDRITNTFDAVKCLREEDLATEDNYRALSASIRSMLALTLGEDDALHSGPSGTPLSSAEQVAEFDSLEAEWQKYRLKAVQTGYDQFKGGTEAPVSGELADVAILRSHMLELAFIYGFLLGNH